MNMLDRLKSLTRDKTILFYLIICGILVVLIGVVLFTIWFSTKQEATSPSIQTPTTQPRRPTPTQTLNEMKESQSAADKAYGDNWVKTTQDFPWYSKLPLHTSEYFVYFDLTAKKFIAKIYPPRQIDDAMKNQITRRLQEIGVDTSQYPIEWRVQTQ